MSSKRFRIAFSFAGEKRDFVAKVACILADRFGEDAILYDKFYEAEFATADLGLNLPELYHKESDLAVVVLCKNYAAKEWVRFGMARDSRADQGTADGGRHALPVRPRNC